MDNFNMVYRVVEGTSKQGSVSKSLREREKNNKTFKFLHRLGWYQLNTFPLVGQKCFVQ